MTADDDRIAYLSGAYQSGASLSSDDPSSNDRDVDGSLDADERADLDELRDLLADPLLWVEPPAELEDRVVTLILSEAATATAASATGTTGTAAEPRAVAPPPLPPPTILARRRKPGRAAFWGFVGGAAAALLVVVGAFAVVRSGSSDPTLEAALAPTELVPDAAGSAELTRTDSGWRIELDATGLPRRDGGRFYEAWLRNEAATLVSIGTFNEGTKVTLWSGVTPVEFTTITITEEEADGDPASSGRRVLVGPVTEP